MPLVRRGAETLLHDESRSREVMKRQVEMAGSDPSLMLYSVSNIPGTGNGSAASANIDGGHPVQQAWHVPTNTSQGVPIETENFTGKALAMYRSASSRPGATTRYSSYFESKRRNWEVRIQGRFKRVPQADMFIGIVLRDFNYDQAVAGHSKLVRKTGMALVKSYDLYMSWGDRCAAAKRPDAELSHLVTGMSGWDQIIRTGKGRQPPELGADFKDLGDSCGLNLERNKMGLASYTEAVAEMFSCISTEDTYTLCFWGVSQVIDLLRWQFKIGMNISMATFFEKSPLHVTLYEREKPPAAAGPRNAEAEERHLESQKRYYLDLMFWSTTVECPSLPKSYIFIDAPPALAQEAAAGCEGGAAIRQVSENGSIDGHRISPSSSVGVVEGRRSRLRAWVDRLRWIPSYACSNHEERGPAVDGGRRASASGAAGRTHAGQRA